MKRTILLITVITATLLLLPIASFAAPKDYLGAEGSSYGLIISQEARQAAIEARADRFLLYQGEIDALVLDNPQGAEGSSAGVAIVPLGAPDGIAGAGGQNDGEGLEEVFDPVISGEDPHDGDTGTCGKLGCGDDSLSNKE